MEDFFIQEFRPPDDEMIQYILGCAEDLEQISSDIGLTTSNQQLVKQSAHTMRVLLAMAISGHFLFSKEADHAEALSALAQRLFDELVMVSPSTAFSFDISDLHKFFEYRDAVKNEGTFPDNKG